MELCIHILFIILIKSQATIKFSHIYVFFFLNFTNVQIKDNFFFFFFFFKEECINIISDNNIIFPPF